ncbi:MAG: BrnT family toxin [Brucellaceae bacterium]|nr:BrnT family toxin [Brucellaceae bacterium]
MVFEWDERKREQVIRERGVDLLYAAQIFEGEVLTRIDDREDYGEIRMISLGMIEDECFVVVHTRREDATRLITAWKGGRDERSQYQAGIARRNQENEGKG